MAIKTNLRPERGRDIERRTMRTLRISLTVTVLLALAASAGAQSLADVARREDVRRKQVKKPSRVLTNKDLRQSEVPPAPPATTPPPAEAQPQKPEGAAPAEPEVSDEEKRQKAVVE